MNSFINWLVNLVVGELPDSLFMYIIDQLNTYSIIWAIHGLIDTLIKWLIAYQVAYYMY